MNQIFIYCILLFDLCSLFAQGTPCGITFEYDNAGNRVKRYQCLSLEPANPNSDKNQAPDRFVFEEATSNFGSFYIYPNPSTGVFQLSGEDFDLNASVDVLDSKGQILLRRELGDGFFDLSTSPPGIYFLEILCNSRLKSIRFVKE